MRNIIKGKRTTWIDIQNPTKKDIGYLREKFNFHPLVLEELIIPSNRSKVERYPGYLYMIFYYPIHSKEKRETRPREVDIIVTKDTVITSHYFSIFPVKALFDRCNLYAKARNLYMDQGTGYLLFYIVDGLWKSCITKLSRIGERIDEIEKKIFEGREKEMVLEISLVKTDIINFWRIIEPQKKILESLFKEGSDFFEKELTHYFSDILGTFSQAWNALLTYKETILAMENTNQALLSSKINEIMKVLTIFSVIFLPLTLIASIWGMNFKFLPLSELPLGFWGIIAFMVILSALMFIYFRKKRWI